MPQIKASTFSHFKDIPLGTHKVVIKRRMKLARNKKYSKFFSETWPTPFLSFAPDSCRHRHPFCATHSVKKIGKLFFH